MRTGCCRACVDRKAFRTTARGGEKNSKLRVPDSQGSQFEVSEQARMVAVKPESTLSDRDAWLG